jgi:hypothetical protein
VKTFQHSPDYDSELRTLFAALAMQGLVGRYPDVLSADQVADLSYQMADAMMEEPSEGIASVRSKRKGFR